MKQLTCEMCGGTDLMKQDGAFVCQNCGMKYSVEEAKKMMIEGTVDVQGTVKVDNTAFVQKYLANARRAKQKKDWKETEKYYNMVEQNDPANIEAVFYSSYAQVMLALLEVETITKRQSTFDVLSNSVSVIDDNYDNTNEEHQKLLFEIMDDIYAMKKAPMVPTTHLQDYVTKNAYGNIIDRNQIIEDDSLDDTYKMIYKIFVAYMDSLANIIVKYSPEPVKKLFISHSGELYEYSDIHDKVAAYIDGYKTPEQVSIEIASKVKVDDRTTSEDIDAQIKKLVETICPSYMSGNTEIKNSLIYMAKYELIDAHPDCKAIKLFNDNSSGGCYVATAVYGSYDCPQVWTLRRYRDYTLAETWHGRAFIKIYYAISPTLVKWFGHTEWFKKMWQGKLDRMVAKLQAKGVESTPYEDRNW